MKILLINGCPKDDSLSSKTLKKLSYETEQSRDTYTLVDLKSLSLKPCLACDVCQNKTPGRCAISDGLNEILQQYLSSALVIILTPVIFGCCNQMTKIFLDRMQPLFLPYQKLTANVMHPRYDRYPDLKFIGLAPHSSKESIDNFKAFLDHCTLALQSKQVTVHTIATEAELNKIQFLG